MQFCGRLFSFAKVVFFLGVFAVASAQAIPLRTTLHEGWLLQSSCKVPAGGERISSPGFAPKDWYGITVPSTVFAAQVAAGEFSDPYVGDNLRKLPGMSYPVGGNFANLPMPQDSPYRCSWWYRTVFQLPASYAKRNVWLHFGGINYRANIWLNGYKLGDAKDIAGTYRTFELDVTSRLVAGPNVLAVEVFAPTENDLGMTWVDWNPMPPDKEMGLWGDVFLSPSGPVTVRYPQVVTHFPDNSLTRADLTVMAIVHNQSDKTVDGVLEAELKKQRLRMDITLRPNETRNVSFTPEEFPGLRVDRPKLWWPRELGEPNLHGLTVRFLVAHEVSDEQHIHFGIREITSELTGEGYRLFRVNGKKILIRGGGWAPDMLLRESQARLEDQFRYVLGMNLNTIRLEGKLESDDFFNLADRYGILVMAGWCCCDMWEKWPTWHRDTLEIATDSLRSQVLRLRSHPSLLVWLNGSDGPPPAEVESAYIKVLQEEAWPNPYLSSASARPTKVTGPTGVKMTGPYDYEPPSYWLTDRKYGGAFGFNTETSPGPAVPVSDSVHKFIPSDHSWPLDEVWNYHAGGGRFRNLDRYNQAMAAIYGAPSGLQEYTVKSQAMAYEGQRAMFEAYRRNKYVSTGVIQWMLNNSWPSTIWHLYDYYLQPGGGYFGTRKANEPLHVQYSYDDRTVVVVNGLAKRFDGLSVTAKLYDFQLKEIFSGQADVSVDADGNTRALTIPPFPSEPSTVYFVKLWLRDEAGAVLSSNFYWLPAKLSVLDWDHTPSTAFTPVASFENMTVLNQLPRVRLQVEAREINLPDGRTVKISVQNPGEELAFQIHLSVLDGQEEILPVLWDDNYLSLLPGESAVVTASYAAASAAGHKLTLRVDGWNIEPATIPLKTANATGGTTVGH